jgi:hypothetical protein
VGCGIRRLKKSPPPQYSNASTDFSTLQPVEAFIASEIISKLVMDSANALVGETILSLNLFQHPDIERQQLRAIKKTLPVPDTRFHGAFSDALVILCNQLGAMLAAEINRELEKNGRQAVRAGVKTEFERDRSHRAVKITVTMAYGISGPALHPV